ncbi:MAG TPA: RraA family protein, partial [Verrucomicrobiae bacterium]|nr:RraA family protein [Verrucomicrobiae bacterium]
MKTPLTPDHLEALRRLSTCAVANAIDTFDVRLRNEGYSDSTISCLFPRLAPMLGYAVTLKIRCSSPPPKGHAYLDRTDWWNYILKLPEPRVVVIQDVDDSPGTGAFLGEVHSSILLSLGCVGAVTNGAVRDLPAVESMRFQLFSRCVAVSHAYSHIVEIGGEVEIGGLKIKPGDLLHGDQHGVLSVPEKLAAKIPPVVARIEEQERKLIALCRSSDFTLERLIAAVKE